MLALLLELLQERFYLFVSFLLEILIFLLVFFGLVLDPTLFFLVFLELVAEMFDIICILFDFCILCIELMLHLSYLLAPVCVEVTHAT